MYNIFLKINCFSEQTINDLHKNSTAIDYVNNSNFKMINLLKEWGKKNFSINYVENVDLNIVGNIAENNAIDLYGKVIKITINNDYIKQFLNLNIVGNEVRNNDIDLYLKDHYVEFVKSIIQNIINEKSNIAFNNSILLIEYEYSDNKITFLNEKYFIRFELTLNNSNKKYNIISLEEVCKNNLIEKFYTTLSFKVDNKDMYSEFNLNKELIQKLLDRYTFNSNILENEINHIIITTKGNNFQEYLTSVNNNLFLLQDSSNFSNVLNLSNKNFYFLSSNNQYKINDMDNNFYFLTNLNEQNITYNSILLFDVNYNDTIITNNSNGNYLPSANNTLFLLQDSSNFSNVLNLSNKNFYFLSSNNQHKINDMNNNFYFLTNLNEQNIFSNESNFLFDFNYNYTIITTNNFNGNYLALENHKISEYQGFKNISFVQVDGLDNLEEKPKYYEIYLPANSNKILNYLLINYEATVYPKKLFIKPLNPFENIQEYIGSINNYINNINRKNNNKKINEFNSDTNINEIQQFNQNKLIKNNTVYIMILGFLFIIGASITYKLTLVKPQRKVNPKVVVIGGGFIGGFLFILKQLNIIDF